MMHPVTDCPEGCVTHSQSLMCLLALFAAVLKLLLSLNSDCRNVKKSFRFMCHKLWCSREDNLTSRLPRMKPGTAFILKFRSLCV